MSQVEQVKEASDIVTIIGERISLQRAGSQYRALCPFHSERSPSFFVSETMQRFKCFGCGESGDVYEFLQKYEGMSFGESLRYLADRAGIKLEAYQDSQEDQEKSRSWRRWNWLQLISIIYSPSIRRAKSLDSTPRAGKLPVPASSCSGWDIVCRLGTGCVLI